MFCPGFTVVFVEGHKVFLSFGAHLHKKQSRPGQKTRPCKTRIFIDIVLQYIAATFDAFIVRRIKNCFLYRTVC